MTDLLAVDIGGTHARFALADISTGQIRLSDQAVFRTADYASLSEAWRAYEQSIGRPLPTRAGIAVAAPVEGDSISLTNNGWQIRRSELSATLGIEAFALVNDFAAVAYAASACGPAQLDHVCGPVADLPTDGAISVVGPGTGLGVAILYRSDGEDRVLATEGGHVEFAPIDALGVQLRSELSAAYGRVSVERVVSGPGLRAIHAALGGRNDGDDAGLWALALGGEDPLADAALAAFCRYLGAAAGDFALAHGANAVVIGGGVGLRIADHLARSDFPTAFAAKGRFSERLAALPVKLITHSQPGLLGAAAAFAADQKKRAPLQG